jgi:hypothetical protein
MNAGFCSFLAVLSFTGPIMVSEQSDFSVVVMNSLFSFNLIGWFDKSALQHVWDNRKNPLCTMRLIRGGVIMNVGCEVTEDVNYGSVSENILIRCRLCSY